MKIEIGDKIKIKKDEPSFFEFDREAYYEVLDIWCLKVDGKWETLLRTIINNHDINIRLDQIEAIETKEV